MRQALAIVLLFVLTTMPLAGHLRQDVPKWETGLVESLQKLAAEQGFSGVVLIAQGNHIFEKSCGFADVHKKTAIQNHTKFYIASMTKQLTATAILKLEEQGKLSVSDPLTKYLKNVPSDKAELTLHHLLSHSSGLAQNYAADGITQREKAIQMMLKNPLVHRPGEKFTYSNDNYSLLAAVVEIASGTSYESFLQENFLTPLNMSETGFWGRLPAPKQPRIAEVLKKIGKDVAMPNWGFRGATGMYSTAHDLYLWQQALFEGKILKPAGREKLFAPYFQTSRGMHGYGWFRSKTADGKDVLWTAGSEDFGHNGLMRVYGDGTVVVVLSNAGTIAGKQARDVALGEIERIVWNNGK
ncbi:MAG: serine hydrolase [Blastocatellia bacterium]|nr:serine hydrolase [Blastocatellia bacterium]